MGVGEHQSGCWGSTSGCYEHQTELVLGEHQIGCWGSTSVSSGVGVLAGQLHLPVPEEEVLHLLAVHV